MIAEAYVETSTPSKYINRLCKHFAHKVTVNYDENHGEINFKIGKGYIEKITDGLKLKAEADNQTDRSGFKKKRGLVVILAWMLYFFKYFISK